MAAPTYDKTIHYFYNIFLCMSFKNFLWDNKASSANPALIADCFWPNCRMCVKIADKRLWRNGLFKTVNSIIYCIQSSEFINATMATRNVLATRFKKLSKSNFVNFASFDHIAFHKFWFLENIQQGILNLWQIDEPCLIKCYHCD